eukprot:scaffold10220_cov144-Isochrysis_galbana.AAC.16
MTRLYREICCDHVEVCVVHPRKQLVVTAHTRGIHHERLKLAMHEGGHERAQRGHGARLVVRRHHRPVVRTVRRFPPAQPRKQTGCGLHGGTSPPPSNRPSPGRPPFMNRSRDRPSPLAWASHISAHTNYGCIRKPTRAKSLFS